METFSSCLQLPWHEFAPEQRCRIIRRRDTRSVQQEMCDTRPEKPPKMTDACFVLPWRPAGTLNPCMISK